MRCPKCKQGRVKQQVSVIVETDADNHSLNKKSLRKKQNQIIGVLWDQATWYCDQNDCGFVRFIGRESIFK